MGAKKKLAQLEEAIKSERIQSEMVNDTHDFQMIVGTRTFVGRRTITIFRKMNNDLLYESIHFVSDDGLYELLEIEQPAGDGIHPREQYIYENEK